MEFLRKSFVEGIRSSGFTKFRCLKTWQVIFYESLLLKEEGRNRKAATSPAESFMAPPERCGVVMTTMRGRGAFSRRETANALF